MANYRNNKPRMTKRSLLTALSAVLVVGGILFGLESTNVINLYHRSPGELIDQVDTEQTNNIDYSPATSTDNEDINAKKENGTIDQGPSAPTNDTTIQITFIASAQDNTGGPLEIRTLLEGTTNGSCSLSLSHGSSLVQKSSAVVQQNNYFVCEAFSIPYNELANGDWTIKLKVTSGDGRTNEASTTTTIN